MPLIIKGLGSKHTGTQTHIPMHKQKQFQKTWHMPATKTELYNKSDVSDVEILKENCVKHVQF